MTKEEVAEHLRGLGYDAQVVEGVIVVYVDKMMTKRAKNALRKSLQSVNYCGSWGWKVREVVEK